MNTYTPLVIIVCKYITRKYAMICIDIYCEADSNARTYSYTYRYMNAYTYTHTHSCTCNDYSASYTCKEQHDAKHR